MSNPKSIPTEAPDFSQWMRTHYALVLSQTRRMMLVREDAEDAAQQAFVKAWKAWNGFSGDEPQRRSWLLRITRNTVLDALRKRNLRRMKSLDAPYVEQFAAVMSSPDFEGDEILAKLHAAISTLPPKQRWVFQSRYFDDRSYAELTLETGTSEGALKASYHHARKKLEHILKQDASSVFH